MIAAGARLRDIAKRARFLNTNLKNIILWNFVTPH